ncbi:hypothetical protein BG616_03750 [Bacillus subtilis]|nr:hypothetical protein BG616_03750 [Bacillus subtilis]
MVILDRSDMISAAFWIPVITVKIAGSLYIVVYGPFVLTLKNRPESHVYTNRHVLSRMHINTVISLLLPFHLLIVKSKALFGAKAKH